MGRWGRCHEARVSEHLRPTQAYSDDPSLVAVATGYEAATDGWREGERERGREGERKRYPFNGQGRVGQQKKGYNGLARPDRAHDGVFIFQMSASGAPDGRPCRVEHPRPHADFRPRHTCDRVEYVLGI